LKEKNPMIRFPIKPRTRAQLEKLSSPQAVAGGQSEVVYHTIYDTATYTSAATTEIQFFNTARANQQLTNFGGRGQFPEPQFFIPHTIMVDPVIVPAATAFTDMHFLLFGTGVAGVGSPIISLEYANKTYGPWPLSLAHGTGGPTGMSDTTTAVAANEMALNSYPDGGIWLGDSVCFAPNQQFSVNISWAGAVTLGANCNIRVSMAGEWYRRVA
jgi:hypothetical protein